MEADPSDLAIFHAAADGDGDAERLRDLIVEALTEETPNRASLAWIARLFDRRANTFFALELKQRLPGNRHDKMRASKTFSTLHRLWTETGDKRKFVSRGIAETGLSESAVRQYKKQFQQLDSQSE